MIQFNNENLLSKKASEGLKVINPKTPKFYITPKTNKENNPGGPVINSINSHISQVSRFDHHLQPLKEIPSYIKDTNDYVNKINNFKLPESSLLVPNGCKCFIYKHTKQRRCCWRKPQPPKKTVATIVRAFLALILTLKDLISDSKFYLQIKGCAMGTICAPAYANLFMSEFEER